MILGTSFRYLGTISKLGTLGQEPNVTLARSGKNTKVCTGAHLCTDVFVHTGLYTSVQGAHLCTEGGSVHKCVRCTLVYASLVRICHHLLPIC